MKDLFEPVMFDETTQGAFCPCGCELEYDQEAEEMVCSSDYCDEADTEAPPIPAMWRGRFETAQELLATRYA